MNTAGHGGRTLRKTIRVETNDPKQKNVILTVNGPVKRFVTLSPSRVRLAGEAGTDISATVNIIPEKEFPFKIKNIKAEKGEFIKWRLESVRGDDNSGYALKIENLKKDSGRYFDRLTMTTDNSDYPEISLRVYGQIFQSHQKDDAAPKRRQHMKQG